MIQTHPDYHPQTGRSLASILSTCPTPLDELAFLPAEDKPVPIASLPLELMEPVLKRLDLVSIERFASTCWKARAITAKSLVWRRLVERIYRGPMYEGDVQDLVKKHDSWRSTLIEEDRVRLDGCYISVCHYM